MTTEVVYLGKREIKGGAVAHAFVPLNLLVGVADTPSPFPQDDTLDIEKLSSLFKFSKTPCSSIGGVYSCEAELSEDGKISTLKGDLKYVRPIPAELAKFSQAWKQLNDAYETTKRRKSAEKNADNDPVLSNAIAILRGRYIRVPAGYRRGFQLWLLDELEKRR